MTLREVCPRCGQSLYWCGESGVCVAKKVVFELSHRFHVEVTDDPGDGWTFRRGFSDRVEAERVAAGSSLWKHARVVDTEVS